MKYYIHLWRESFKVYKTEKKIVDVPFDQNTMAGAVYGPFDSYTDVKKFGIEFYSSYKNTAQMNINDLRHEPQRNIIKEC